MANLTPQEFAEKYMRRIKASSEDIRRGVDRVKDAPGKRAAQKKEKFRNGIMDAIDSGKWERNVSAVSTEEWKAAMRDKGIGRIAAGVDAAKTRIERFAAQLSDYQAKVKAMIDQMPDNTPEDRLARMNAWVRAMSEFRYQR